jgi:hypothetical protein
MEIQKRSHAGVMTIAIMQLVFGILWLPCDLFTLSGANETLAIKMGGSQQAQTQQEMQERIPYFKATTISVTVVDLILSILMIVSGVGLIRMRMWGRTVANGYAILSIIYRLGYTVYYAIVMLPIMNDIMEKQVAKTGGPGAPAATSIIQASSVVGVIFSASIVVYPIIVLVIVNMAGARAALSGIPADGGAIPSDYDDRRDRGPFGSPDDRYRQAPDDRTQSE